MNTEHLKQWLLAFWAWFVANPAFTAPIVGALIAFMLKPRSPEQYAEIAKTSPRWAAFRQLLAAIFPDLLKTKKIFFKLIYGNEDPLPPPRGPSILPLILVAGLLSLSSTACTSVQRSIARGAVLTSSAAVKTLDETCGATALETGDLKLAGECADAYEQARIALVGTAHAVDAWDDAKVRGSLTCAIWNATEAMKKLAEILTKRGVKVPSIVADALDLREKMGTCGVKS